MGIMLSLTWGAVVKICVIIAFAIVAGTFVKCMHDNCCKICKK